MSKRWYVVHAYSGFENHVKRSLEEHIKRADLQEKFGDILVPTEGVVEMRDGQKRKVDRKFFPGYVLVQMEMDDETWHLVKDVPKVMGFIGGTSDKPTPITDKEAEAILQRMQEGVDRPVRRCCSKWARWSASRRDPSPTSTAWLRRSTTRRTACASPCRSSAAPRRWSWNSVRSTRIDPSRGRIVLDTLRRGA